MTPPVYASSSPVTIEELINEDSAKYGVSSSTLTNVLTCESGMGKHLEGDVNIDGVGTTSWGVAMIHLKDHPEVTKAEALDTAFSVDFLAKNIAAGRGYEWTCWRKLYAVDNSAVPLDNKI